MAPVPGLTALQSRKRDLLLESEVNRQLLRLELTKLRVSVERLRSGFTGGGNVWKWLAPVAGFILARRVSRNSTFMARGSLIVSMLGAVWKLWSAFKRSPSAEAPEI